MLLALVLAACVAPAAQEWVEISQQHYRKPSHLSKPGNTYPSSEDTGDLRHKFYPASEEAKPDEDDLTFITDRRNKRPNQQQIEQNIPNRVYVNHSIAEHHWNNDRVASIKRVDGNAKIRPNITPEFSLEIFGEVTESELEVTSDYSDKLNDKEVFSATVERVPNKGSVKRVQLLNTPVKSPSFTRTVSPIRRSDVRPYGSTATHDFSDEFEIEDNIFKTNKENAVTSINQAKKVFSSTQDSTMWKHDRNETSTSEPVLLFKKYPHQQLDNANKYSNNLRGSSNIFNVENISTDQDNNQQYIKNAMKTKLGNPINEEKIEGDIPNVVVNNVKINKLVDVDLKDVNHPDLKNSVLNEDKKNFQSPKTPQTKPNSDSSSNSGKNRNDEIKVNTMENVMKFVKVVADTISKNTNRGVNGKVKYLNELKETLLSSIKERIDATWPDDAPTARRRRSHEARGHVEFPSSESSLMTISFLTFAVFLIKLVLQVIQTYKNKTMMVAPLVVATAGRALPKLNNFH